MSDAPRSNRPEQGTRHRIFLVVADDSEEMRVALHYACRRARRSNGRVALLYAIEPTESQHWAAVEDLIRAERRTEAEQRLLRMAKEVYKQTGTLACLFIRDGDRREELVRLIRDEPLISILVLAAGMGPEGPGPLVTYLTGAGLTKLRIPLTVVPGSLSTLDIDDIT